MITSDRLPRLPARRVVLRWLEEADVDPLFSIFSDPEVMRYWSSPPLVRRSEAVKLLEEIRDYFQRKELFQWGIAREADDRVVGTCTLTALDAPNRRAEVGFALGRAHWGQGLMTEALGTLFDFAFDQLKLRRIEADIDPRNQASIRVVERLGFRREGLLRERWLVDGEVQDSLFYGLLSREWKSRSSANEP